MNDFLVHYGISGQKWGVRRFQNGDGTLTAEGKERYESDGKDVLSISKKEKHELTEAERAARKEKVKKFLKVAGAVTLAAAAGYAAYKVADKWTKGLQDEYKSQAGSKHKKALIEQLESGSRKQYALQTAKVHNDRMMRNGPNYDGIFRDSLSRHASVMKARDFARQEASMRKQADYYKGLYDNATRLNAVRNFIKNNGTIKVG